MNLDQNAPAGAPRFPMDNYRFRIVAEPEFKVSKKGNDMYVFTYETIGKVLPDGTIAEVIRVDGADREIAGWEFTDWATFFTNDDGVLVNPKLVQIHKATGLPLEFERDETTGLPVGITYTGLEFFARANSQESNEVGEDGKPIINPVTGKPVKRQQRRIIEIYA